MPKTKQSTAPTSFEENVVYSNVNPESINKIRNSLSQKIGTYQKNLKNVEEFSWSWQDGRTKTLIRYKDKTTDYRENGTPPPTKACHDIAHFVAAFHGNLEWDYLQPVNHLCEYNAVAIEWIMTHCCYSFRNNRHPEPKEASSKTKEHMQWFCNDYYRIPERHPSRPHHQDLINKLCEDLNPKILSTYFDIFYELWCIEVEAKSSNFEASVRLTSGKNSFNEEAYRILKKTLEDLAPE
jgi:hypothetical protein